MAKKPDSVVGLDIGASGIKAVEVLYKGDVPVIQRVESISLSPGVIREGMVMEPNTLENALMKLWKAGKFTSNVVKVGIGGDRAITRQVTVPWYEDKILSAILPEKAEEHLPMDRNDYYLDYHTLRESISQEVNPEDEEERIWVRRKNILIAGGLKKDINSLVTSLKRAGLRPISIDVNGLALLRSFRQPEEGYSSAADVNIDIGAETLTIVIHKFGQPVFIRTVSGLGGRIITEKIAKEFNIPFHKAEKRKIDTLYSGATSLPSVLKRQNQNANSFFASNDDESDIVVASDQMEKTRKIIGEQISEIISNIRETSENFLYEQADNDLNKLSPFVLSGGVSATPHFIERLSSEFQKKVQLAAPLSAYDAKGLPEHIMSKEYEYAVAVGLAVGKGSSHG